MFLLFKVAYLAVPRPDFGPCDEGMRKRRSLVHIRPVDAGSPSLTSLESLAGTGEAMEESQWPHHQCFLGDA